MLERLGMSGLMTLNNNYQFYVGKTAQNWITILNVYFEMEMVEKFALELSGQIKGVFLSVYYFDNDYWIMNVIEDGKKLTTHIAGESMEYNDLQEEIGDIKIIKSKLDLNVTEAELEKILRIGNLETQVTALEKVMGVTLWSGASGDVDDDRELAEKFEVIA